jgi:hypothetical protein
MKKTINSINTVSVIVMKDNCVWSVNSFDTNDVNGAEVLFTKRVIEDHKAHGEVLTVEDIDIYLEEGMYDNDKGTQIFIVWSDNASVEVDEKN